MKICHVLASHGEVGGLEKHVIELSREQAARGNDVSVLASPTIVPHLEGGVRGIAVQMHRSRRNPRLLWELVQVLRAERADIAHAHSNKPAAMLRTVRRWIPCPTVATVHNVKRNQSMFNGFEGLISTSRIVADSLPGAGSTVIWNAVNGGNPNAISEAESSDAPFRASKLPVVLAAGRFVEAKGYDLLLQAIAQLPTLKLWLIGDGPMRPALERLAASLGIANRIWMPGFRQDAVGFMPLADLFVISSHREGGPYTLAEALRERCPVLSTPVGYAPELLDEFALCPETSTTALRDGLSSFLADPNRFRAQSEPAFARAAHHLALPEMIERVTSVYREVLSKAPPASL